MSIELYALRGRNSPWNIQVFPSKPVLYNGWEQKGRGKTRRRVRKYRWGVRRGDRWDPYGQVICRSGLTALGLGRLARIPFDTPTPFTVGGP